MSLEGHARYQLDREVGRGAFAAVYLAHRAEDGVKVAIKHVLRKSRRVGVDWTALREVKLLRELQHENIVRVLDVFALPGSINMVMELCPFDLKKVIDNKAVLLTEENIKSYMRMMLVGTKVMHEFWVLHRDLKPDNLLIGADRQLKLADFGLARIFGEDETRVTYKVVTLPYRAPELLFGAKEYGVGVDTWSIGCIMAELMMRKIFLPGTSDEDQLAKIFWMFGTPTEKEWPRMTALKHFVKFTERAPVNLRDIFRAYSAEAVDLLEGLMKINPADRLNATQALEHKFFTTSAHPATPVDLLPFDALTK